jgi:transcriptional regulator with XRE-family HTH domain
MNYIQNIKNLLKEKSIQQYEIAPQIGVTPTTFSNWMGERNPMPMPKYIELCNVLKVSPCYFFSGEQKDLKQAENVSEIERLLKENSRLKDRIIELQDRLFSGYNILNDKAG